MRRAATLAGSLAFLCACHGAHEAPAPADTRGAPAAPAAAGHALALPFIENDYPRALARAREANLPLFVEVWAPW